MDRRYTYRLKIGAPDVFKDHAQVHNCTDGWTWFDTIIRGLFWSARIRRQLEPELKFTAPAVSYSRLRSIPLAYKLLARPTCSLRESSHRRWLSQHRQWSFMRGRTRARHEKTGLDIHLECEAIVMRADIPVPSTIASESGSTTGRT
jgi:hypothetical protein